MKKVISLILALCMMFALVACGGPGAEQPTADPAGPADPGTTEPTPEAGPFDQEYKIAVCIPSVNAQMLMFQSFYENIADAFNCEFVFSEALDNDIEAELQFMENSFYAGCTGYISFNVSTIPHAETVTAKANELGMYVAINGQPPEAVSSMPYLAGSTDNGTDGGLEVLADSFADLIGEICNDGKTHNIAIATMGASMGSRQHIMSTAAVLDKLQEMYDLTYSDATENLAALASVTDIETASDMKIRIVPGVRVPEDIENTLKTGEYDVLFCVGPQYAWYESIIASVEQQMGVDIRTCSVMGIDESTATSFHTPDASGNPSLNCAIIKNNTTPAILFVILYNALSGHGDVLRNNGVCTTFDTHMWACKSAEQYDLVCKLDTAPEYATVTIDELKNLLVVSNPEFDYDVFTSWIAGTADLDALLAARGIK